VREVVVGRFAGIVGVGVVAGREVSEDVIRSGLLSDALRETYCALSSAPLEVFSILESETTPRTSYMLIGALLAAQDAAEREIERAAPKS
jgi:hypothetical protein